MDQLVTFFHILHNVPTIHNHIIHSLILCTNTQTLSSAHAYPSLRLQSIPISSASSRSRAPIGMMPFEPTPTGM